MKCPGQDTKYWTADAIFEVDCPKCDNSVEFYKDDTSRKCHHCGHRFVNPKLDFGCASYCPFAEQCLGTLPDDFKGVSDSLIKDKIAVEMKRYHHNDFKSIRKASNLAQFAEKIAGQAGESINLAEILCTSLLLGVYKNDPTAARQILDKVETPVGLSERICFLLEEFVHNHDSDEKALLIIHDAQALADLQRQRKSDPECMHAQK